MQTSYCLVLQGRLPASVTAALSHRFTVARIWTDEFRTVLDCSVADQSALRSLLTQLWDVGGTVLLVADVTTHQKGPHLP